MIVLEEIDLAKMACELSSDTEILSVAAPLYIGSSTPLVKIEISCSLKHSFLSCDEIIQYSLRNSHMASI